MKQEEPTNDAVRMCFSGNNLLASIVYCADMGEWARKLVTNSPITQEKSSGCRLPYQLDSPLF